MTTTSKYHPYLRVSWRLESINILAREITGQHDTCRPRRHHEWPWFMTMIKELGRLAPFPSVRLPCDTIRCDICGSPVHYPGIHHCRRGEESSNSVTIKAPMFSGPHLSRMHQYIIKLACWSRRSFVNRDKWGLPPRSSESDKRPLSTFPSSVLHSPLIGPARSHIVTVRSLT
jgi:hypothetical protein